MSDEIKLCSFCGKPRSDVESLIRGRKIENTFAFICPECIRECQDFLDSFESHRRGDSSEEDSRFRDGGGVDDAKPGLTPSRIVEHLDEYVIGQDQAKKTLAVAVHNHYKRLRNRDSDEGDEVEIQKSNILLIGPTGSGKTLLCQSLAKALEVPFVIADATTLTEAGYVGEDVEQILAKLLNQCDGDSALVERGIVYIDEIDKLARKSENPSITRDVSGEGVQQALLKLIEGTVASVPPLANRKHPRQECDTVDTTNILFICGGAFDGLEKIIQKRTHESSMGFDAAISGKEEESVGRLFAMVEPEDLVKYGIIPELVGRLPVLTTLSELDEDAMIRILTEPKNALTKQYSALFGMEGVKIEFEKAALRSIAALSLERRTGARGLRSIMEKMLLDTMFELPDWNDVETVTITKEVVEEGAKPKLKKRAAKTGGDALPPANSGGETVKSQGKKTTKK